MPTTRTAGGRVRIQTSNEGNGQITSVSGKTLSGRSFLTLELYQNIYDEQGVDRMGTDEIGRMNRFGFSNSGYILDIESVEAYCNALDAMVRQVKAANAAYAESNNVQPVQRAGQAIRF